MTLPTSVAGLLSRGQWGRTDPNRPVAAVAGLPVLGARDRSDAVRVVARFPASGPGALWPGGGSGLGALPWTAPWQLVTYSLLHGDLFHILFNMFAVWMFGANLERVWGARRLAFTYVSGVIAGAIAQLIVGAAISTSSATTRISTEPPRALSPRRALGLR